MPSGKASSVNNPLGNKAQTLSPSHRTIAAPQAGANIKSRNTTPPSLARNSAAGVLANKRKTFTDSYIARPDGDYTSSVNGGNIKSIEGNSSGHLPKFCHECGTKYPVDWAKFCCECGIRRMILWTVSKAKGPGSEFNDYCCLTARALLPVTLCSSSLQYLSLWNIVLRLCNVFIYVYVYIYSVYNKSHSSSLCHSSMC